MNANNEKRFSVREVAKIMGVSDTFIRVGLQQGRLPFGTAVQTTPKTKITSGRWVYYINPVAFEKYIKGEA